jgi:hypothetical protein
MAPGTYDMVALLPAMSAPPRFVSILAARQNDTRPSGTYHTIQHCNLECKIGDAACYTQTSNVPLLLRPTKHKCWQTWR